MDNLIVLLISEKANEEGEEVMENRKLSFACDYMKGAHPDILQRIVETNMMKTDGYGLDEISEAARERIRQACQCREACVEFLVGGTQTNAVVINAFLRSYQGVIAAGTGHISVHEAGAVELGPRQPPFTNLS